VVRGSHGAIIVGVDGSQDATAALAWALRHAQVVGLVVSVVHAWLPDDEPHNAPSRAPSRAPFPASAPSGGFGDPGGPGGGSSGHGQRVVRDRAISAQAAMERVHKAMAAASSWVPIGRSLVTQLVARGEPGAILVELTKDCAQLVVGATGSGALPGMLIPALGSTTRFVLRHARCPVTVVPSTRLRAELVTRRPHDAVPPARTPAPGAGS
jgi:nucleotide-binding universal stress UspA family protein